jgi:hypothetical protein
MLFRDERVRMMSALASDHVPPEQAKEIVRVRN